MDATAQKLAIASRYAAALDRCDYEAAGEFLAADCRYHVASNNVRIGAGAILDSYRESDVRARREFDRVDYSSGAAADSSGGVRLTFIDQLHRDGRSHTFRCIQVVHFDSNGKIAQIELQELLDERERLNEFRASFVNLST